MRIGKQDDAFTAVATSDEHSITVRGHDLCGDLIGRIGFTDYFWLLVAGERPSEAQRGMMDACLAAIAEHGLVPSVQAARMTLAAAPEAYQGAMGAGILGMGSVVAGSSEVAGRYVAGVLADAKDSMEAAAERSLKDLKSRRAKVPGLGHPQHSTGDPRANRLYEVAGELGFRGEHCRMFEVLRDAAPGIMGRPLPINVSGAIPATLLDAGWPIEAMKSVPILARVAGLAAHLLEEQARPIGFIMSHHADLAIDYDGAASGREAAE